jgi:recombinational DNA repair protein RecT
LIPGYKGLVKFVRRTGQLESWDGEVVREGDAFRYQLGDDPRIEHVPADDQDRPLRPATHVYVIFRLTGGRLVRSVWTASKVDAHKEQYSPGWKGKDSPWRTSWDAMAIKTLVRDLINRGRLPMSDTDRLVAARADDPVTGTVMSSRTVEQALGELDSLVADEPQERPEPSELPTDVDVAVFVYGGAADAGYVEHLAHCVNLGEVSALEEAAVEQSQTDDDRAYAKDMAERRRAEIRDARSEVTK